MDASQSAISSSLDIVTISQVFNNFAIGIGAILASAASIKVISDWLKERQAKKKVDYYRAKYPSSSNGKTFELIEGSKHPGKVYLLDLKTNKKHHIASIGTLYDLGFDTLDRQIMKDDVVNNIENGDYILTRGEIGS